MVVVMCGVVRVRGGVGVGGGRGGRVSGVVVMRVVVMISARHAVVRLRGVVSNRSPRRPVHVVVGVAGVMGGFG